MQRQRAIRFRSSDVVDPLTAKVKPKDALSIASTIYVYGKPLLFDVDANSFTDPEAYALLMRGASNTKLEADIRRTVTNDVDTSRRI